MGTGSLCSQIRRLRLCAARGNRIGRIFVGRRWEAEPPDALTSYGKRAGSMLWLSLSVAAERNLSSSFTAGWREVLNSKSTAANTDTWTTYAHGSGSNFKAGGEGALSKAYRAFREENLELMHEEPPSTLRYSLRGAVCFTSHETHKRVSAAFSQHRISFLLAQMQPFVHTAAQLSLREHVLECKEQEQEI